MTVYKADIIQAVRGDSAKNTMMSLMVAFYVMFARFQRYSFRGNVIAFVSTVMYGSLYMGQMSFQEF